MTDAADIQPSLFSIGRVIERTFGVVLRHLPVLLFLAILEFTASDVIAWVLVPGGVQGRFAHLWRTLADFPGLFIGVLLAGAIAHRTFADLNGEKTSLAVDVGTAIRAFKSLIGVELARLSVVIAGVLVVGIPAALLQHSGARVPVMLIFGIIAGVLVVATMLAWAVAEPAVIAGKLGTIAAFRRSADLTDGYRGHIFGLMLLLGLCLIVPMAVILLVGGGHWVVDDPTGFETFRSAVMSFVRTGTWMVSSVGYAVIYTELLHIKGETASPPQQMPQP